MDRLRGPPVLKAGNKQQTDPVRFSDGISHKKGMTMNLKNKKGKRLTSTLMAVLMSVSTTLTPVNTMASEPEISSAAVESTLEETTAETQVQIVSETAVSKTQEQTVSEMAASEAQTSASEMQSMPETTAEAVCTEEVQTSGEGAEETSANETRGPDETQESETTAESESETEEVTETETVEETSSEEPTIDLSNATREDILSYIEAIGGDESDAFYSFIGSLGEYDYQLVWMAQYGAQEDQLLENFGFDYDGSSDLDVAKYIHKLSEDELADFTESMTFEQYRRYLSIKEMMAEMDRYEDEGDLYLLREVWVKSEQGSLRAEAYLYNKGTQGCLERSCWQPKQEEEIWYACYGSNLSEERFRCYVQGGVAPNGNRYYGCNDTTLWKESYWTDYRGRLYFGNKSPSWDYSGVAFYDPAGHESVLFRLYRITRDQLHDIMRQEGASANWYGHQFLLGMGKDNLPVYTLISSTTRPQKAPIPNYLEVIRTALEKEAGLKPKEVKRYLDKALNA